MKYYCYEPDADSYAGVGVAQPLNRRVLDLHFRDEAVAPCWTPIVVHTFREHDALPPGDFPSLSNYYHVPVFSQRAWDTLQGLIGSRCEALPIVHPRGGRYLMIHVLDTVACLDASRSHVSRNEVTGRISRIYLYALKHDLLKGKHIFKLPLESGADLLVDDEFRDAVETHDLEGLLFKELPLVEE